MDFTELLQTALVVMAILQVARLIVFRSPWVYLDEAELALSIGSGTLIGFMVYDDPLAGVAAGAAALLLIELYVLAIKYSAITFGRRP